MYERIPIKYVKAKDIFDLACKYSRGRINTRTRNHLYPAVDEATAGQGEPAPIVELTADEIAKVPPHAHATLLTLPPQKLRFIHTLRVSPTVAAVVKQICKKAL